MSVIRLSASSRGLRRLRQTRTSSCRRRAIRSISRQLRVSTNKMQVGIRSKRSRDAQGSHTRSQLLSPPSGTERCGEADW
ncbi:hypothetical protein M3J09_002179 [Ascochyta lentis]